MIESYVKEIEQKLKRIEEENKENIDEIINIQTSNRYCIGSLLYSYGKVYNIIFNSENYEQAISRLEKIRLNEDFEHIDEEIRHYENVLFEKLKKGISYNCIQLDLEQEIFDKYINDILINRL